MDDQFSINPQNEAEQTTEQETVTEPVMAVPTTDETEAAVVPESETTEPTEETAEGLEDAEAAETDETVEAGGAEEDGENEPDPLAGAFQYYAPEQPKSRNWPIIVLAVLMVLVLVGGLLWAFGVFDKKENADGGSGTVTEERGSKDVSDLTAMQSASFTVSNGMIAFNMETQYQNLKNQYGSYLSSLGLDTSASLKDQNFTGGSGTWFEYLADYAKNDAEWMLVMSEAAAASGVTLDDTATAQIEQSLTYYDPANYHNGVSTEDMRAFLTMYYNALAQQKAMNAAATYTDAEIEAYYQANAAKLNVCDYAYYPFTTGGDDDAVVAATIKKLTACTSADAFKNAVVEYMMTTGSYADKSAAAAAYEQSCVKKAAAYADGDGVSDWLFDAATKVGSVKSVSNTSQTAVYMLTGAPTRDTTKTVSVRHILLTADTYGSDDAAKAKADEILATWKTGEATASSFGALAAQYTEDSNGADGGLYEGVTEGQMVTEFNDWCFDTARKTGDSGVVQTSYGYHVMYFDGARETWQTNALSAMKDAAYNEQYEALCNQYPVTVYDDAINQIEL